eukprot:542875_1
METATVMLDYLIKSFDLSYSHDLGMSNIDTFDHQKQTEQLNKALQQYYSKKELNKDMSIASILNHFLYLLNQCKDNDALFENIYMYFDCICSYKNCRAFRRLYIEKETRHMFAVVGHDIMDSVTQEIMDIIHCYFIHSYDIGYRLTSTEKRMLDTFNDAKLEEKENNLFINNKIACIQNILHTKQMKIYSIQNEKNTHLSMTRRMGSRYNQLPLSKYVKKELETYTFGTRFKYTFSEFEKKMMDSVGCIYGKGQVVQMRFMSLKEETTQNVLCSIPVNRWNTEYMKASLLFESLLCKQKYRPFVLQITNTITIPIGHIKIEYLLAILIYCNHDRLQLEFSKTYQDNVTQHEQFYHL